MTATPPAGMIRAALRRIIRFGLFILDSSHDVTDHGVAGAYLLGISAFIAAEEGRIAWPK
ncbi:MAG: hypothetical protein EXS43_07565 [Opitutus sp.]|nr:hypothetical protein [Opitutus sp.]